MHSNRIHTLQRAILREAANPVWRRTSSWKLLRMQQDLRVGAVAGPLPEQRESIVRPARPAGSAPHA